MKINDGSRAIYDQRSLPMLSYEYLMIFNVI